MAGDAPRGEKLLSWNFLLLWQGQFVSFVGSQVFLIGMIFWMKRQTGSAAWVGMVTLASSLPAALLGLLGGTFADRMSRRSIILFTDFLSGVLSLGLASLVLVLPDQPRVILAGLLVTAFLLGALGAFFRPAIQAAIPDIVPASKVTSANSWMGLSMSVSAFVGQAVGGVLYRLLGPGLLFLINGLSFLFSGVSELFVRIPQEVPDSPPGGRSLLAEVRRETAEGLRYIWADRGLTTVLVMEVSDMVFIMAISVLFPFYVEDHLGASPDWYGYLIAVFGLGNALGVVLAGAVPLAGRTRVRLMVTAGLLATAAGISLGRIHTGSSALILLLAAGAFAGFNGIHVMTAVQVAAESRVRGRVLGVFNTLTLAAIPLAAGMGGVVADLLEQDIASAYTLFGAGLVVSPLLLLSSREARALLAYPQQEAGPG